MRKRIIKLSILFLSILVLTACSLFKHREPVHDFIITNSATVMNTLIDGSVDDIYNMFDMINDSEKADLLRFKNNLSNVKRVYVNAGGYEHSKGKNDGTPYEYIKILTGNIVTDNNIYSYAVDFTVYDEDELVVNKLWLISGRTEAIENRDWVNKYHFPGVVNYKGTHIVYADYYDSNTSVVNNYKLIWGQVLGWDANSAILEVSDFDKNDINTLPYNSIITKYGKPGAIYDTGSGYHMLFYKTSEEGKYTQLFLNDDDTVSKIQNTDEIAYGITKIERIR